MTSLRSGVKMGLMKKLFLYIFTFLMVCSNSFAIVKKYSGEGELFLNEKIIEEYLNYLNTKTQDHPLNFFISEDKKHVFVVILKDTNYKRYSGSGPISRNKKKCERKLKQKCYLFSNTRFIVWNNGINPIIKEESFIKGKITRENLISKLEKLGFIGESKNETKKIVSQKKSNEEKKNDQKEDEIKELENELAQALTEIGKLKKNLEKSENKETKKEEKTKEEKKQAELKAEEERKKIEKEKKLAKLEAKKEEEEKKIEEEKKQVVSEAEEKKMEELINLLTDKKITIYEFKDRAILLDQEVWGKVFLKLIKEKIITREIAMNVVRNLLLHNVSGKRVDRIRQFKEKFGNKPTMLACTYRLPRGNLNWQYSYDGNYVIFSKQSYFNIGFEKLEVDVASHEYEDPNNEKGHGVTIGDFSSILYIPDLNKPYSLRWEITQEASEGYYTFRSKQPTEITMDFENKKSTIYDPIIPLQTTGICK